MKLIKPDDLLINDIKYSFTMDTGVGRVEFQKKKIDLFLQRADKLKVHMDYDEYVDHIYFKYIYEERSYTSPIVIDGSRHKNGRSSSERTKRSSDHFKREVLPELGRDEQRHFGKKYGNNKK